MKGGGSVRRMAQGFTRDSIAKGTVYQGVSLQEMAGHSTETRTPFLGRCVMTVILLLGPVRGSEQSRTGAPPGTATPPHVSLEGTASSASMEGSQGTQGGGQSGAEGLIVRSTQGNSELKVEG